MDRKNTMLLTVIAVATLLVAVVGATFAYFTFYGSNLSGSTAINAAVGTTGTVTMTSTNNTLYLYMPVQNMQNDAAHLGTYYANSATATSPATKTVTTHNLASITTANTASGQSYTCTFNATFTVADQSNNAAAAAYAALLDADSDYTVTLPSGVTIDGVTSGTPIGIATLKGWTTAKAGTANISADGTLNIVGQLTFHNTSSVQNGTGTGEHDISGVQYSVTVSFSNFECTSQIS